jgi:hypothetical protein
LAHVSAVQTPKYSPEPQIKVYQFCEKIPVTQSTGRLCHRELKVSFQVFFDFANTLQGIGK